MTTLTDTQQLQPHQRLLVALDVPTLPRALSLVTQLQGQVGGFKVGLELCSAVGVPDVVAAISAESGAVFLDLKLKDIPNTVAGAVQAILEQTPMGVRMLTLHCDGGSAMLQAAVTTVQSVCAAQQITPPLLLGVTILTSLEAADLTELGITSTPAEHVVRLAKLAQAAGLDGVVASPQEVAAIKQTCGAAFLAVTPGIRPAGTATGDQQRVMTPQAAVQAGADYLVIGRPITAAANPLYAVRQIVDALEELAAS